MTSVAVDMALSMKLLTIRKVRECNFTDMVRCGNQYVKKFVFGTDDFVSEICKQPCQNLDFSVRIDFDH